MQVKMNSKIEKLINEYSGDLPLKNFLRDYTNILIAELEVYSDRQYRKYLAENSNSRNHDWFLGKSEGADDCVKILKEILD